MSIATAPTSTPLFVDWRRRYRPVRELGRGGCAVVLEAWTQNLGRAVALKVIDERRGLSARALREVQAAAALSHPGVVQLYDFFTDGENSYLSWELVHGQPLSELRGRLDDAEAVGVVVQALDAISHAHSQGVVHRDVKPANIMLDEQGQAKVMDFGIARLQDADTLTAEGDLLGTVAYMSPEQAAGRRAGPASDVYSAAVVLFELLTGVNPARGATSGETLSNIVSGRVLALEAVRPELPRELTDAVDAALRPLPAERPSAAQLAAALRRVLVGRLLEGAGAPRAAEALHRWQGPCERVTGAALGGTAAAVLLAAMPAYPPAWTLPLAATVAAVWALLPGAGLALLLGTLAFPFFNASLYAGGVYVAAALVLLLVCRRRPVCAVWPVGALLLMPLYATLLAPAAAAVLGRRRGPLTAAWAAAVVSLYLVLAGQGGSPFAGFRAHAVLGHALRSATGPGAALASLGSALLDPAILAQMAAWAGLAVGVRMASEQRTPRKRLALCAASFGFLLALSTLVPAALGRSVDLGRLLPSVAVAAVVVILALVAGPGRGRFGSGLRKDTRVQEDRAPA